MTSSSLKCPESIANIMLSLATPRLLANEKKAKSEKIEFGFRRQTHKRKRDGNASMHYRSYRISGGQHFTNVPFKPFYLAAQELQVAERLKDEKVFSGVSLMQRVILTDFWRRNYGQTPTQAQIKRLCTTTQMDQDGVRRWFAYRNSESYRRRMITMRQRARFNQWTLAQNRWSKIPKNEKKMAVIL